MEPEEARRRGEVGGHILVSRNSEDRLSCAEILCLAERQTGEESKLTRWSRVKNLMPKIGAESRNLNENEESSLDGRGSC